MDWPSIILCLLIFLLAVYSIKRYARNMTQGCCGSGGTGVKHIRVKDKNKSHYPYEVTLHVEGMMCAHCVMRVENVLNSMEGVWAQADLKEKKALVRMKIEIDSAELCKEIASIGYQAELIG